MDPSTLEITIKTYLTEMRERLEQAASIAKAADACAEAGHLDKAIPLYSVPGNHDVENTPSEASV